MNITILGAGAYGIALALAFYRNQNKVTIWTKVEEEKEELLKYHENRKGLPGVIVPNDIMVTSDLSCVKDSEIVVLAISIPFFRSTCLELKEYVNDKMHFCIASKGIENDTNQFAHEILKEMIETSHISILSGPTFAIDLANNSPSGLSLACLSQDDYEIIRKSLESSTLKIVSNDDLIGTELCGAVKNIIAILSGMLEGMKVTETTKALFLTEAIEEMKNLILSFDGQKETAYTLAGMGDLILTCTSSKSRNFTLGVLLATKEKEEIDNYIQNNTVEGYFTLKSIYQLIKEKNISSPMIELLYQILFQNQEKKELLTLFELVSSFYIQNYIAFLVFSVSSPILFTFTLSFSFTANPNL